MSLMLTTHFRGSTTEENTLQLEDYSALSNNDLVQLIEKREREVQHLGLENEIFENYLSKNEPQLLIGYLQMVKNYFSHGSDPQFMMPATPTASKLNAADVSLTGIFGRRADSKVTTTGGPEKAYRINLSTKTDLAMRELEEQQISFNSLVKKSHKIKADLKAELEEIKLRIGEVVEATNSFDNIVVTEGRDQLTQKIPAERFIRFMEEWIKKADVIIGKMRLRIASLKTQYTKVNNLISQKVYLGETVHAVDFDKIRIENQYLIEKIDQKNVYLLELKQLNGEANLLTSNFKKYLLKEMDELNQKKKEISEVERKIKELNSLGNLAETEVSKQDDKLNKILTITERYKVPETVEYIKTKAELQELKKKYKTLLRKNSLEMYTLNQLIEKMKKLTGSKKQRQSWFSVKSTFSDLSLSSEEFGLPIHSEVDERSLLSRFTISRKK